MDTIMVVHVRNGSTEIACVQHMVGFERGRSSSSVPCECTHRARNIICTVDMERSRSGGGSDPREVGRILASAV